jgi:hypothetical protein
VVGEVTGMAGPLPRWPPGAAASKGCADQRDIQRLTAPSSHRRIVPDCEVTGSIPATGTTVPQLKANSAMLSVLVRGALLGRILT